jgi:hypothetical protein
MEIRTEEECDLLWFDMLHLCKMVCYLYIV